MATPGRFEASAIHGVNSFVWSKLQEEFGWTAKDYGGRIPITTPQQSQEFNDLGKPYILYNYRMSTVRGTYGYKEDHARYQVNSPKESDIRKTLNLLDYYLGSQDASGSLINDYIHSLPAPNSYREFEYKTIMTPQGSGANPTGQEGGIMDGAFEFSIRYTTSRMLGFIPTW